MKKKKIWSTITRLTFAFMFVVSWAVLGVALALKTAKIEIGGGITFTATDVYAKISGSVTGTKSSNPINEHDIEFDASTSSDFTVDSSWTNMNLDFQNASTPIVVTITIENKSSERPFWIVFTDNIENYLDYEYYYPNHNTDVIRKVDGTTLTGRYEPLKLEKNSSVTIESTLSVHSAVYSVDDNFKLGIELIDENAIKDESEYTKLTFTTNDTYKTASVKASSTDIEGEVIIPALFSKNGEVYKVNKIEGYNSDKYNYIEDVPTTDNVGFANCTRMTSVYIPATITSIGAWAFGNCTCSCIAEPKIGWREIDTCVYDYNNSSLLVGATGSSTSDPYGVWRI